MHPLKVLFVTSEIFPLIKTGGLADVSGSLPHALQNLNVDIRVLIPGYPAVLERLINVEKIGNLHDLPFIGKAELLIGRIEETNVPVMVVKAANLYERDGGPYIDAAGNEWLDNGARFGVLSKVAAQLGNHRRHIIDWRPDVIHCNDWQTGLTPAYLKLVEHSKTKTVMSLHNMAFQGCFSETLVADLHLPREHFVIEGLEYHGQLSFLKAGIFYADAISTVSPKYAQEIQTPAFGFGLDGLLAKRHHDITGILNGIDTNEWNPKTDPHLSTNYSIGRLNNKALVKAALQSRLNLDINKDAPLLGVVSRLTYQKGLDLFLPLIQSLLDDGCQLVLLGSGDASLEHAFSDIAQRNPGRASVTIGYNEPLSHQIMAGSDMFVMPSRFEPCGLNQMYGLAYGTPPIVNATGGLADSVTDTNKNTLLQKTANGFVMSECSETGLQSAIEHAINIYRNEPKTWRKVQRNGMSLNLDWDNSAQAYLSMYERLVKN